MNDILEHHSGGPVLIVGGYGTVGTALTKLAAPSWPLLLTGRNPASGAALATEHNLSVEKWDLDDPAPFSASVRAVISTVNDPQDRVLRAAATAGIPYVDITRWTSRLAKAVTQASLLQPSAPVLLSSSWMGGIVSIVAAALAEELGGAQQIDIAIRYDTNDKAGADSVDFIDRLGQDFEITKDGKPHAVSPLSDSRWVDIGGHRTKVARLDTPEQLTLPLTLGAQNVSTHIGFSSNLSTTALLAAKSVGLFRWGRGTRWTPLRRSLLYSPGTGGAAHIRIDVQGKAGLRTATISDPAGQAHLTALGGFLGLKSVLHPHAKSGVSFPESTATLADALTEIERHGVTILKS